MPFMATEWQKTAIFSWNFDLFLTFFMDCGHIYVPKGAFCLSTLQSGPKGPKRVLKGLKWPTYVFLTIWDLFGPIWALLDPFKQELIICSEAPLQSPILSIWGKKIMSQVKALPGISHASFGGRHEIFGPMESQNMRVPYRVTLEL